MLRAQRALAGAIGLVTLASLAGAQGYSADFEPPAYSPGPLEGQGIWINWGGGTTAFTNVVASQNHTSGGSQAIEVADGADTVADFDALPGGSFDSGAWNLSVWTLVPAGSVGTHEFLVMNNWDLAGNYEWNAWISLDASGGLATAHTPDGTISKPLVVGQWVELRCEYDLDGDHVDIYYNGSLIHGYDPRCGTTGGCATPYATSAVDAIDLYPDPLTAPSPIFYDDLVVEPGAGPDLGTAYCFGDGTGTACPCGNTGGAGEGCANSTGAGGVLDGGGSASVSADDAVFSGANLLPGQPGLLFFGDAQVAGGDGAVFGDGLRCAGQNVVRRGVRVPDANGDANWGPGLLAGTSVSAGDTKHWQIWYRNPSGSPCGAGFNLTNGYSVTYVP
jgi:hypothetical protein